MSAQVIGAFVGLEFALLLRVIYPTVGGNYEAIPAFVDHLPGIATVVG